MTETARNLLVGLFVLASITVLCILMVWFGEVPDWIRTSEWTLRITGVNQLSGIGEGSAVTLNGVEIGRVKGIEFVDATRPDKGVVVLAGIRQQYYVPAGAVAHIYGATLGFGRGRIDVVIPPDRPGKPLSKEDARIPGVAKSMIQELISRDTIATVERTINNIGQLADAATPVAENLSKLLEQRSIEEVERPDAAERGAVANLSTVIERLDGFIANLNTVLGDPQVQEHVKAAVRDVKDATESLRTTIALWHDETARLADNLNAGIDRTEANLDHSFAGLNRVLENLDDASKSLVSALQNLERGRGTAGLLFNDDRLYEAAVLAVLRFSEVMANLEAITGKIKDDGYITVGQAPTGILKKRFPTPAQTAEYE